MTAWKADHWHRPSDQWHDDRDASPLARFGETVRAVIVSTASTTASPAWKPDSFFATRRGN